MDVIVGYPPNYKEIEKRFQVSVRTIYAWGNIIYNPHGIRISGDLMAHEKVHSRQQKAMGGPEKWWARYLSDEEFLVDQEVEAYGRQYQFLCSQNPNKNFQFDLLQALAGLLAGPLYGYPIEVENAMNRIRIAAYQSTLPR